MDVRDASVDDLDAIREVVFAVGHEYGYAPEPNGADRDLFGNVDAYFEPGGLLRVLVDGAGKIVGMLGVVAVDGETIELRKLYLLPEARGGGHGYALLREAIEFARGRGAKRIVLETAYRLDRAAQLYERAGFTDTTTNRRSPTCDRSMELRLE